MQENECDTTTLDKDAWNALFGAAFHEPSAVTGWRQWADGNVLAHAIPALRNGPVMIPRRGE